MKLWIYQKVYWTHWNHISHIALPEWKHLIQFYFDTSWQFGRFFLFIQVEYLYNSLFLERKKSTLYENGESYVKNQPSLIFIKERILAFLVLYFWSHGFLSVPQRWGNKTALYLFILCCFFFRSLFVFIVK